MCIRDRWRTRDWETGALGGLPPAFWTPRQLSLIHISIYATYKYFTNLRKTYPAFRRGTVTALYASYGEPNQKFAVFGYEVTDGTDTFVIYVNPSSKSEYPYKMQEGTIICAPQGWQNKTSVPGHSMVILKK